MFCSVYGKLYLLCRELAAQNIGITGICEHRWSGSGHFNCEDHLVIYSGAEKSGQSGVAMILDKEKGFLSYDAISDRILTVHFNTKPVKTTVIQIYAPSTNHSDDEIEDFYNQLQSVKDSIHNKNQVIIMGDFNAKVGEGASKDQGLGPHGIGKRNESGEKLLGFCQANGMNILNTWFKNHIRRKWTWISPDKATKNQIDYILVSKD